jgi:hypothetical protein
MSHKVPLLLLSSLLLTPILQQVPTLHPNTYVSPWELARSPWQSYRLNSLPTTYVTYQWYGESNEVDFQVYWRSSPTATWNAPLEHTETVSYYITAVAPLYSGNWDSLYVIGVLGDGTTVIEKWQLAITNSPSITVSKNFILSSAALTNIRAAAVAPNDQFLIVQRHETQEILRIDLSPDVPGPPTVLLMPSQYPNLAYYDVITWRRHTTQGDVFLIEQGRGTDVSDHSGSILIWDADLDGVPNSVEELTATQFHARGYDDGGLWQPDLTLYAIR